MSDDFTITNCHVHTFTLDHVPDRFLPFGLLDLLRWDEVRRPLMRALIGRGFAFREPVDALMIPLGWLLRLPIAVAGVERDQLERALRFAEISTHAKGQAGVLSTVRGYYPRGARFVVLPMDMAFMNRGKPPKDLPEQHDELARLAAARRGEVIPFATFHPDRKEAFDELRRCVETHGFRGLKLYPPLGYPPDHPRLMEEVYPYCVDHGLPVISHCSRGGVRRKGLPAARAERYASPHAFQPVLKAFPDLRVCLAHFGGQKDWQDYLRNPVDPDDEAARERNWVTKIRRMIHEHPNLYTDISYTIFYFGETFPALRVFLEDERLRDRVLFGSDYYMAELEAFYERALSIRLRHALGPDLFRRIAETNVRRWLGEPEAAAAPPAADRAPGREPPPAPVDEDAGIG